MTSQFHGFSSPSTTSTLTHPNDPTLAEDFAHANSTTTPSSSAKKAGSLRGSAAGSTHKTVRFQDNANANAGAGNDDYDPNAAALFNQPYRDDPDAPAGYRDAAADMDNVQVHAHHSRILAEQDEQLDRLGESISRQRELSMQIGNELEDQVALLEDQEALVDRHQSRLDRARKSLGKVARTAGESKQMVAIVVLIVILVLLIAVLK